MPVPPQILVIGVGNEYRRDDGVGRAVVRALPPMPDGVKVMEASGDGADLMEAWRTAKAVILIDAVHSGAPPGTVYRLNAIARTVPSCFFRYSTHAFSVAEAVELARTLDRLPPLLVIYGIEGREFAAGTGLSPEVARAAVEVAKSVRAEVDGLRERMPCTSSR
jgi:hydrogenase maturation protease